jgi:hypothetical protein
VAPTASHQMCIVVLSRKVKRPDRETDPSPLISVEVKNDWKYTFTHSVCLHGFDMENVTKLRHQEENQLNTYLDGAYNKAFFKLLTFPLC